MNEAPFTGRRVKVIWSQRHPELQGRCGTVTGVRYFTALVLLDGDDEPVEIGRGSLQTLAPSAAPQSAPHSPPVTLDAVTLRALADACTAIDTMRRAGHYDPDMTEPPAGWAALADNLRHLAATAPPPDR